MTYTQITFQTPEARVRYAEAALEVQAREVVAVYEARENTNSWWSDLGWALSELAEEVRELDRASAAVSGATRSDPS